MWIIACGSDDPAVSGNVVGVVVSLHDVLDLHAMNRASVRLSSISTFRSTTAATPACSSPIRYETQPSSPSATGGSSRRAPLRARLQRQPRPRPRDHPTLHVRRIQPSLSSPAGGERGTTARAAQERDRTASINLGEAARELPQRDMPRAGDPPLASSAGSRTSTSCSSPRLIAAAASFGVSEFERRNSISPPAGWVLSVCSVMATRNERPTDSSLQRYHKHEVV